MNYSFDIESIPIQGKEPPVFDESTVKLGNVKDTLKIKIKINEAKKQFDEGLNKKMSVDSNLCQIASFGVVTFDNAYNIIDKFAFASDNETEVMTTMQPYFENIDNHKYVGWNSKFFDIPVIWKRSIATGINVLETNEYLQLIKRYDYNHSIDLKHIWTDDRYYPLKDCCKFLGIPCKTGLDGSMIYDAFKEKRWSDIEAYNLEDCMANYEIFKKLGL